MKLILLYGPPAAGKLTIAKRLSKITGITLFHSHMLLNDLADIFGYDNPARRKLEFEFKTRVLEEAINQDIDLLTTGSITSANINYYTEILRIISKAGGEVLLVRLKTDKKELFARVSNSSRRRKINNTEKLRDFFEKYPENLNGFGEKKHLIIDTTKLGPGKAALKIVEYYKL